MMAVNLLQDLYQAHRIYRACWQPTRTRVTSSTSLKGTDDAVISCQSMRCGHCYCHRTSDALVRMPLTFGIGEHWVASVLRDWRFLRMPPSVPQAKSWNRVVDRQTCKDRHCHHSEKSGGLCFCFSYFGLMFGDTLVLHGVCGLQTMCLQYMSLAKMACHFGSSSQGNLRSKAHPPLPALVLSLVLVFLPNLLNEAGRTTWALTASVHGLDGHFIFFN